MKPGRNDPCPCGSGKKYKHCCLASHPETPEGNEDAVWRSVSRAVNNYAPALVRFIQEVYGHSAVDEAWDEFMLWDDDVPVFDAHTPHMHLFTSWFFHFWTPDVPETAIVDQSLHDRPPTAVYLERARRIDPVLRRYLEACMKSPPSFFEIVSTEAGRSFDATDVFTGELWHVMERTASQTLGNAQIIFAQIVPIDGIVIMEASSRYSFKPGYKIQLLEFRERMVKARAHEAREERKGKSGRLSAKPGLSQTAVRKKGEHESNRTAAVQLTREDLFEWDSELRQIYHRVFDEAVNPPVPELTNTDGEKVVMHEYTFEVESARAAFDALKHLAAGEQDEDLLVGATWEKDGALRGVQLAWHGELDPAKSPLPNNPVLGFIEIDGTTLKAQLNSVKRATAFRRTVEKCLGDRAKLISTEVTDVREAMLTARQEREVEAAGREVVAPGNDPAGDPMNLPVVRDKVRELMTQHYEHWLHEKIPALGGRTPLQAVRSIDGRARVEALVGQIEHDGRTMNPPLDPSIVAMLRSRLEL